MVLLESPLPASPCAKLPIIGFTGRAPSPSAGLISILFFFLEMSISFLTLEWRPLFSISSISCKKKLSLSSDLQSENSYSCLRSICCLLNSGSFLALCAVDIPFALAAFGFSFCTAGLLTPPTGGNAFWFLFLKREIAVSAATFAIFPAALPAALLTILPTLDSFDGNAGLSPSLLPFSLVPLAPSAPISPPLDLTEPSAPTPLAFTTSERPLPLG